MYHSCGGQAMTAAAAAAAVTAAAAGNFWRLYAGAGRRLSVTGQAVANRVTA